MVVFLFQGGTELYNLLKYEYTSPPGKKNDHLHLAPDNCPSPFDGFPLPVRTHLNVLTERGRLFMILPSATLSALALVTSLFTPPHAPLL